MSRFNLKWDRRTLFNILKVPFIILIRVPVILSIWGMEWVIDWSEIIEDKLPAWKTR